MRKLETSLSVLRVLSFRVFTRNVGRQGVAAVISVETLRVNKVVFEL